MNQIDANVFIRYLIGDDAAKQQKLTVAICKHHAGR